MLAGLDYARGEFGVAALIESNVKHPSALIIEIVKVWKEGTEIVTAVRTHQDPESLLKVKMASWFYRIFNKIVDSIQLKQGSGYYFLLSVPVLFKHLPICVNLVAFKRD